VVLGGEEPIQRRPAHPKVFGDVPARMSVRFHPLRNGDVLGFVHLAVPPKLGSVGARCCPLQRSTLFCQFTLAKQVSFLKIPDSCSCVRRLQKLGGSRVRIPGVTGESDFQWV
jgi:hypothetical protein